ncbi:MAG: ATP synthase F1 subunit epsilon [Gemmataceae bacterium]
MSSAEKIQALQCLVVTPEKVLLDSPADFVALPLYDGELGVLPGRRPLVGKLGYGALRVRRGDTTLRMFVDGGFVQIRRNVVTVLTPQAWPCEQLDAARLRQELQQVQQDRSLTPDVRQQRTARLLAMLRMMQPSA